MFAQSERTRDKSSQQRFEQNVADQEINLMPKLQLLSSRIAEGMDTQQQWAECQQLVARLKKFMENWGSLDKVQRMAWEPVIIELAAAFRIRYGTEEQMLDMLEDRSALDMALQIRGAIMLMVATTGVNERVNIRMRELGENQIRREAVEVINSEPLAARSQEAVAQVVSEVYKVRFGEKTSRGVEFSDPLVRIQSILDRLDENSANYARELTALELRATNLNSVVIYFEEHQPPFVAPPPVTLIRVVDAYNLEPQKPAGGEVISDAEITLLTKELSDKQVLQVDRNVLGNLVFDARHRKATLEHDVFTEVQLVWGLVTLTKLDDFDFHLREDTPENKQQAYEQRVIEVVRANLRKLLGVLRDTVPTRDPPRGPGDSGLLGDLYAAEKLIIQLLGTRETHTGRSNLADVEAKVEAEATAETPYTNPEDIRPTSEDPDFRSRAAVTVRGLIRDLQNRDARDRLPEIRALARMILQVAGQDARANVRLITDAQEVLRLADERAQQARRLRPQRVVLNMVANPLDLETDRTRLDTLLIELRPTHLETFYTPLAQTADWDVAEQTTDGLLAQLTTLRDFVAANWGNVRVRRQQIIAALQALLGTEVVNANGVRVVTAGAFDRVEGLMTRHKVSQELRDRFAVLAPLARGLLMTIEATPEVTPEEQAQTLRATPEVQRGLRQQLFDRFQRSTAGFTDNIRLLGELGVFTPDRIPQLTLEHYQQVTRALRGLAEYINDTRLPWAEMLPYVLRAEVMMGNLTRVLDPITRIAPGQQLGISEEQTRHLREVHDLTVDVINSIHRRTSREQRLLAEASDRSERERIQREDPFFENFDGFIADLGANFTRGGGRDDTPYMGNFLEDQAMLRVAGATQRLMLVVEGGNWRLVTPEHRRRIWSVIRALNRLNWGGRYFNNEGGNYTDRLNILQERVQGGAAGPGLYELIRRYEAPVDPLAGTDFMTRLEDIQQRDLDIGTMQEYTVALLALRDHMQGANWVEVPQPMRYYQMMVAIRQVMGMAYRDDVSIASGGEFTVLERLLNELIRAIEDELHLPVSDELHWSGLSNVGIPVPMRVDARADPNNYDVYDLDNLEALTVDQYILAANALLREGRLDMVASGFAADINRIRRLGDTLEAIFHIYDELNQGVAVPDVRMDDLNLDAITLTMHMEVVILGITNFNFENVRVLRNLTTEQQLAVVIVDAITGIDQNDNTRTGNAIYDAIIIAHQLNTQTSGITEGVLIRMYFRLFGREVDYDELDARLNGRNLPTPPSPDTSRPVDVSDRIDTYLATIRDVESSRPALQTALGGMLRSNVRMSNKNNGIYVNGREALASNSLNAADATILDENVGDIFSDWWDQLGPYSRKRVGTRVVDADRDTVVDMYTRYQPVLQQLLQSAVVEVTFALSHDAPIDAMNAALASVTTILREAYPALTDTDATFITRRFLFDILNGIDTYIIDGLNVAPVIQTPPPPRVETQGVTDARTVYANLRQMVGTGLGAQGALQLVSRRQFGLMNTMLEAAETAGYNQVTLLNPDADNRAFQAEIAALTDMPTPAGEDAEAILQAIIEAITIGMELRHAWTGDHDDNKRAVGKMLHMQLSSLFANSRIS